MPDPTTPSHARRGAASDAERDDELGDMDAPQSPQPSPPLLRRRAFSTRSLLDQHHGHGHGDAADETSALLDGADGAAGAGSYGGLDGSGVLGRSSISFAPSTPGTPRPQRQLSYSTNTRFSRNVSRRGSFSFSQRLVSALGAAEGSRLQRRDTGGIGEWTYFPRT
jgi:hypothetical protein